MKLLFIKRCFSKAFIKSLEEVNLISGKNYLLIAN